MSLEGTIYLIRQNFDENESEKYQTKRYYKLFHSKSKLSNILDKQHNGKLIYAFYTPNYKLAFQTIYKILDLKYKTINDKRIIGGDKMKIIYDMIKVQNFFKRDIEIFKNYRISQILFSCDNN